MGASATLRRSMNRSADAVRNMAGVGLVDVEARFANRDVDGLSSLIPPPVMRDGPLPKPPLLRVASATEEGRRSALGAEDERVDGGGSRGAPRRGAARAAAGPSERHSSSSRPQSDMVGENEHIPAGGAQFAMVWPMAKNGHVH